MVPLFLFLAAAVKIVPWVVGGAAVIYGTKKITQSFGSTPINEARKVPGMETMTPKQLFNERKEWRKNKQKYHAKKDKKIQSEIDKLNEKFKLEDEEKTKLSKELEEARKNGDKEGERRILAALAKQDEKMAKISKDVNKLEKDKKENGKKRDATYENFDDNQSQEEFVSEASSINWKSWKNYGIIGGCFIVGIMLIGLIKKLFSSLLSSVK